MIQKRTRKPYLMLGISILCLFMFMQCKKSVDYVVKGTYVYVNSTDSLIEVKGGESFIISPKQTHTIVVDGEGGKDISAKSYEPPFGSAVIVYGSSRCDTLRAYSKKGILGIDNYNNEKIADRNYKFTYTFTETDYKKAVPCK
jgi:hypothetical protein